MSWTMPEPYDFTNEDIVEVALIPVLAMQFQKWLRDQGLHLGRIPGTNTYIVGVSDERWNGGSSMEPE